jgi:hypothetical protein
MVKQTLCSFRWVSAQINTAETNQRDTKQKNKNA